MLQGGVATLNGCSVNLRQWHCSLSVALEEAEHLGRSGAWPTFPTKSIGSAPSATLPLYWVGACVRVCRHV